MVSLLISKDIIRLRMKISTFNFKPAPFLKFTNNLSGPYILIINIT